MNVLFTEPEAFTAELDPFIPSHWNCTYATIKDQAQLIDVVSAGCFEVIFCRLGLYFDSTFFEHATSLKILATPTTGLDHIDLSAARKFSVDVLSLRGQYDLLRTITTTAEHAWALLLACNRRLPTLFNRTLSNSWARADLDLHQLSGQNIGIIGLGRLGSIIADYAVAFRMNVFAYDPLLSDLDFPVSVTRLSLDSLVSSCDHVVLTATYLQGYPLILTRELLQMFKPGSVFINVSRGELVDETALVDILDSGILRAVGVDVLPGDSHWTGDDFVSSPLIEKSKTCDNILITPHVGGYAKEAIFETRKFVVNLVNQFLQLS